MRAFREYHPLVNFTYFAAVILFAMFFMHPIFLAIALVSSVCYMMLLKGRSAFRFQFSLIMPIFLIAAITNPLFNHEGMTVLTYFPNGNPLTLESIMYGAAAGAMLISVICWFSCVHEIMTSDKIIYLFGRIMPSLSLIFSMTLRFVPRFRQQLAVISASQRALGRDASSGGMIQRAKNGIKIFSVMVTWALENAVETADSMKSRGYGLSGRTAFSVFRFNGRDAYAMVYLLLLSGYVLLSCLVGVANFTYFPSVQMVGQNLWTVSVFLAYFLLCAMPAGIEIWEAKRWRL